MLITKSTKINYIIITVFIISIYFVNFFYEDTFPYVSGFIVFYGAIVCIWMSSVWMRIPDWRKKLIFTLLGSSILLWFLMQLSKLSFSVEGSTLSRILWYGSYLPLVLISAFSFDICHYIGLAEGERPRHYHRVLYTLASIVVIIIMTNDLHELLFVFPEGLEKAEESYKHGPFFWFVVAWVVTLISVTIFITLRRMSKSFNRKLIWMPILPIVLGGIFGFVSISGLIPGFGNGYIFHYQQIYSICIIVFWEICIQTGLIRSNSGQLEMVENSDSGFALVDAEGNVKISSKRKLGVDFTKDVPEMLDDHTRLHSGSINGGNFYWTDDIGSVLRLRSELSTVREELAMEGDVLRGEKEYQEKLAKVRTRARLYDSISKLLARRIERVGELIDADGDERDNLSRASIVGAFIKRRSNLEILAEASDTIPVNELRFSIEETMNYVRLRGIDCISEMGIPGEEEWNKEDIFGAYELFEKVVETNLETALAIRTNLSNTLYIYITSTEGEWEEVRYDKHE